MHTATVHDRGLEDLSHPAEAALCMFLDVCLVFILASREDQGSEMNLLPRIFMVWGKGLWDKSCYQDGAGC